jgi:hypothetical protein
LKKIEKKRKEKEILFGNISYIFRIILIRLWHNNFGWMISGLLYDQRYQLTILSFSWGR